MFELQMCKIVQACVVSMAYGGFLRLDAASQDRIQRHIRRLHRESGQKSDSLGCPRS